MSIRAYQLKEIKLAIKPTFNLSQELWIEPLAYSRWYNENNEIVLIEFSREDLERALAKQDFVKEQVDTINQVIKECENEGGDYANYYCY